MAKSDWLLPHVGRASQGGGVWPSPPPLWGGGVPNGQPHVGKEKGRHGIIECHLGCESKRQRGGGEQHPPPKGRDEKKRESIIGMVRYKEAIAGVELCVAMLLF